ncbi:hypothetical protein Hanom_Chr12g01151101 [Helianthus anomalus]
MPVMGGDDKFLSEGLFATDCLVTKFKGSASKEEGSSLNLQLRCMRCQSGLDGQGIVFMFLHVTNIIWF